MTTNAENSTKSPRIDPKVFLRNKFLTRRLEDKLDKMIGFFFWKTYVATTLYTNISTPINLTITIFTALTTAHSSTSSSFISNEMNMKLNLITFVVSILNSYFTPQKEFNELNEYLIKWSDIGNRFEKVIYTSVTYEQKVISYTSLLDEANQLYKDQYIKKRNFLTDLLHSIVKTVFMNSNDRWMKTGTFDFYEKIEEVIELDFDLEELKYENKKASILERICSCFKCCFRCFRKTNVQKNKRVRDETSRAYDISSTSDDNKHRGTPSGESSSSRQSDELSSSNVSNDINSLKLKMNESIIFNQNINSNNQKGDPNKEVAGESQHVPNPINQSTPRALTNNSNIELTDIKVN